MVIYSHSRLSTFEQCKLKFKYRYIDKIIPEIEKSIEAVLGSAVHNTLEWLYIQVKEGEIPTLDDVIINYAKSWNKEYTGDVVIVKKDIGVKGYYEKGIQFLIEYYTKHAPFDDGTLELEKKITITLDEDGKYQIIGFIDRLAQNLQTGEFEIHDYKTGNMLPSQEKIDQDRQLALYSIAIKEIHGHDKNVNLIWHYLAHNKKLISKRTNEQLAKLKQETLDLIKKIENTKEFPPTKSKLCDWCEYKQTCSAWKENAQSTDTQLASPISQPIVIDKQKYPTISKYIKD